LLHIPHYRQSLAPPHPCNNSRDFLPEQIVVSK
jgi:hypothetical protein